MDDNNFTKEQAREFLKQEAINEILEVADFTRFYTRVFYVVAKYGLQLEAKKEELFSGGEWNDPACKDMLVDKIERFFDKHIK